MNKSIFCLLFIECSLSGYAGEIRNIDHIQEYQKLRYQYARQGNLEKAAETDAKLRRIILRTIPEIIKELESISHNEEISLVSYLRKLPDEDYLKMVMQLVRHANLRNPAQRQFLESVIFEPFEGERDNLLAMNWRDQHVRDLCFTLKKKLSSESPHQKTISSILDGELYKNMIYNAFTHGELRIPNHLGRGGYAPQFKKWGENEQQQIKAVKELRQAWDAACTVLPEMKGTEDIARVNQAWENAAQKAKAVMRMLPPNEEDAQQRVGKFFYDTAFSQYFFLAPASREANSTYQKVIKKLAELYKLQEKLPSQLTGIGQFHAEIISSESYLNEEALLLLTKELEEKLRKATSSRSVEE
ncbi:hypothetical protein [uncultured Akkermansia sp.]|uniref:hypothetical protein n=2 Tax=Akkermansia sp. TaxID=1872421 RepID=UPI0025E7F457|nr:hypothetical protein [uncultured Akkermansia sp.]